MRYRATLAYDGTAYQGFQRQAGDTPTIQKAVEDALLAVTQQGATVLGAGRTDAGVHATGQVIAFDVAWAHSPGALLAALNVTLPPDIALQDIAPQPGFHPRFDAASRVYKYTLVQSAVRQPLSRLTAWWLWADLNADAMQQAATLLYGTHDFAAFGQSPSSENTVRTVLTSEWDHDEQDGVTRWVYTIEADAFLKHMVRRVVGALVDVGRGKRTVEQFATQLAGKQLLKNSTIAPPQGLVLVQVKYPPEVTTAVLVAGETPAHINEE